MATYDLGDVVSLTATIRDTGGTLVDATTVTCTITLPDATTATPVVSHPSVGLYVATYTPTVAGRHVARWLATGSNAAAFTEDFTVVAGAPLVTVGMLEEYLQRAIAAKDVASATAALDFATALVWDMVGFDVTGSAYTIAAPDVLIVRGIALRVAAQWFTNPEDRASYAGPEGLSYTSSPQMLSRIMSEADRRTLMSVQLRYAPGFA